MTQEDDKTQNQTEATAASAPEEVSVEDVAMPESAEALKAALETEQAKSDEFWNRLLRAEAEMQNIQRRAKQDVSNAHKFALEGFAKDLLTVLDTFERGIEAAAEVDDSVKEGLVLTHKMLVDVMNKASITVVDPAEGDAFDPSFHQAISMQAIEGKPANQILAVVQKGYTLHGRLLRPANVVVTQAAK